MGTHPRSRGENAVHATTSSTVSGSSPLTRGKLELPGAFAAPSRLIPAHAGKTTRAPRSPAPRRAHPHSREENGDA